MRTLSFLADRRDAALSLSLPARRSASIIPQGRRGAPLMYVRGAVIRASLSHTLPNLYLFLLLPFFPRLFFLVILSFHVRKRISCRSSAFFSFYSRSNDRGLPSSVSLSFSCGIETIFPDVHLREACPPRPKKLKPWFGSPPSPPFSGRTATLPFSLEVFCVHEERRFTPTSSTPFLPLYQEAHFPFRSQASPLELVKKPIPPSLHFWSGSRAVTLLTLLLSRTNDPLQQS